MRRQSLEIQVGRHGRGAALVGHEDAAIVAAHASGRVLGARCRLQGLALSARLIAGTAVGPAIGRARHVAIGIGSGSSHATGSRVDRGRVARLVQPAVEVFPAERVGHGQLIGAVALQADVELAEQCSRIARGRQELRNGPLIGRDHRIGEVGRSEGRLQLGAERIASGVEYAARRRAGGHRPGIAEGEAGSLEGCEVGRRRRGRNAVVAIELQLIHAHVVREHDEDVRLPAGGFGGAGKACNQHAAHHRCGHHVQLGKLHFRVPYGNVFGESGRPARQGHIGRSFIESALRLVSVELPEVSSIPKSHNHWWCQALVSRSPGRSPRKNCARLSMHLWPMALRVRGVALPICGSRNTFSRVR